MKGYTVYPIGKVKNKNGNISIILDKNYLAALKGIEGFGYLNILWWFSESDNEEARINLTEESPYKDSPDLLGTFATRSPQRPNPIALTVCYVTRIDFEEGVIYLAYINAKDGSPVLDIKPYTPSFDRVGHPILPKWCENWPHSVKKSGEFDWDSVFNF